MKSASQLAGACSNAAAQKTFRLFMVTWNVASAEPPADLDALLHLDSNRSPDLYVIGLQEVNAGPLRFAVDMAFEDSWSQQLMSSLAPRGYVKVSSIRMQGLLLLLFSLTMHLPFIRDTETTYTRTGLFGYWGNKGAVSLRLCFYGHALCFVNCHLAAHMDYAAQRVDEFEHILDTQAFSTDGTPQVLDHKLVFWFGDLNFRIEDYGMHFVRSTISNGHFNLLWQKDQLLMMKQKEAFLQEFEEGPLNFRPTYKYDLHSDDYDTSSKKRKPAWTDRILWRMKPGTAAQQKNKEDLEEEDEQSGPAMREEFPLRVKQDLYTCNMEYGVSDHKPVISTFSLELMKKHDTPPVHVCPEGEWSADHDALVSYSILQPFKTSAWDWIGLYPINFKTFWDYVTYTWVKDDEVSHNDEQVQVYVSKDEIPVQGGEFVLCYYSSNLRCIVGISSPFQVQQSKVAVEEGMVSENVNGFNKTPDG